MNERISKGAPADWHVVVSDIKSSTSSIEEGKCNSINFVAACATTAVLNANKNIELPFIFGGDGSTILVPPMHIKKTADVLISTQNFAKKHFNIDLIVGIVPVIDILKNKHKVKVIKFKASDCCYQAVFHGNGVDYAEYLVKNKVKYRLKKRRNKHRADFSGLECLWRDIPSRKEEALSLLVKAIPNSQNEMEVYNEVIDNIQNIYGDKSDRFPFDEDKIGYKFNFKKAYFESLLEAYQYKKNFKITLVKRCARLFLKYFNFLKRKTFDLSPYKYNFIDSEKFDGMLRMVISGSKKQRMNLTAYLEKKHKEGKLIFGSNVTRNVHISCLVIGKTTKRIYFIDGANSSYCQASKDLKNKLKWQQIVT